MKDTFILGIIFVTGLYLLFSSFGTYSDLFGSSQAIPNPHMMALSKEYDAFFHKQRKRTGTPGGAVVIIQDSTIYLMKGYGKRSSKEKEPIGENTVFRLGSVSKGFAAMLTGTFVEEDALGWDSKVRKYVPEFDLRSEEQAANMTVRHLLSQTTGISYHAYTNLVEQGMTLDEIIPRFKKAKLAGKEGQLYSYQNAIYSMVQKVVEKESGKGYNQLMHERLFSPLGMRNASVTYEGIAENPDHALPHRLHGGRYWAPRPINKKYYNAVPAGGVNASISDMSHWLQMLLGNRPEVLGQETINQIFEPYVNSQNKRKYFSRWRNVKEAHYGMGWRVVKRKEDTIVYHGGYVNNFKAEIALNPKDRIAICVLTNAPSSLSSEAVPAFLNMYEEYKKDILNWNPENPEVEVPVL